jgi:hypothetical protein
MSYEDDLNTATWWEKVRVFSIVVALVLFAVSLAFKEIPLIHYARAAAWATAAVAAFFEARAYKRLGRDPDSTYLRGAMCAVAAVICLL